MGDALLEGEHPYGVKPQGNLLHNQDDGAPMTNLLDVSLGRLRQLDDAGISACTCMCIKSCICTDTSIYNITIRHIHIHTTKKYAYAHMNKHAHTRKFLVLMFVSYLNPSANPNF